MADTGQDVSVASSYKVRARKTTLRENIQAVYLDVGSGSAESPVTALTPLPVAATCGAQIGMSQIGVLGYSVEAGSTTTRVEVNSLPATLQVGDSILLSTGTLAAKWATITAINSVHPEYVDVSPALPSAPAAGVVIYFYRPGFVQIGATGVVAVSVGANNIIAPLPMIETAFGAIGPAYGAAVFTYDSVRSIEIDNGTDQDIWVSLDGGATDYWIVRSLSVKSLNGHEIAVNGIFDSLSICYKRKSGAPTTGSVLLTGFQ